MANGQDLVYVENWNGTFDKTTVSNGQLRLVAQPPTFTRSSVAYLSDGTQVTANTPRFEAGKFGNAIMIEEGTTNLLTNPFFVTDSDADGLANGWNKAFSLTGGAWVIENYTGWGGKAQKAYITNASYTDNYLGIYQEGINKPGQTVTLRARGVTNKTIVRLTMYDVTNSVTISSQNFNVNSDIEFDLSLTSTIPSNCNNMRVYIQTSKGSAWTIGDYIKIYAVQLEAKPYATSFIDGIRAAETLTIPTAGVLGGEFTVEFWVKPPQAGRIWGLIHSEGPGDLDGYIDTNGYPYFWTTNANGNRTAIRSSVPVVPNDWNYIAITIGAGVRKIHVNGQLGAQDNATPQTIGTLWLGTNPEFTYFLNGLIDDLRISSRAKTDEEIAAAYQSGQPLPVDEWTTYKLNFDNNLDFNVYGTYITNPIDISSVGRIKSTAIGWNGTNTRVSMSISKNNGVTWSSWLDVTNGGNLPNIVNNSSASGVQIKFMITLIKNSSVNPNFSNFIIEIYTLTIEEAVHYQKIRNLYIKIDLLDKNDVKIGELNGLALDGSVDINSTQAIRRTCDVKFYLSDNLLPSSTSEIWLDKRFRLWVGLKDLLTDDIIYFNLGIFVIGDPQIDVTINQRTIEIKGYDKMCLLDGTIGGQLSNIVNIPLNTSITQAITSTMQQIAGENKLLIDSMKDSNNNDILTPYTIEVDVTKTIYDVINQLGSLYMYYEFFYDVNGYFVFRKRRDLYNDPIIWDFTTYDFRVQSSCQLSFTNVKNYITVYGATLSDGSQPSYTLSISDTLYPDFPYTIEKIGKRTLTISENNYFTTSQCQSRAEYEAWLHTNFNDKLTIYCAPIYSLDVNSLIYLDYPNDGVSGKYTISEINIPLKYDTTMSITAYKVYEQTNTFT